jgi:RecA/RadA recombinase
MEEGRKRALEDAITKIERSFGKGSIMRMGSDAIGKGVPGQLHRVSPARL